MSTQLSSSVQAFGLPNTVAEYIYIARLVQTSIENGTKPSEIAIIARNHKVLEDCARVLQLSGISVYYERKRNILEIEPIRQLTTMLAFVHSLTVHGLIEADELLPEILRYPFWEINEIDVWNISLQAYRLKKTWLEIMLEAVLPHSTEDLTSTYEYKNPETITQIAQFFLALSKTSVTEPAERVIDVLMGVTSVVADEEFEDTDEEKSTKKDKFISPFKSYYFDNQLQKSTTLSPEYVQLLSALRVLISAVRAYNVHNVVKITDVVSYLNLLDEHNKPLLDTTSFGSQKESVNILTAHGSKGLEFDAVYIMHATTDHWLKSKNRGTLLSHPSNLPLIAQADEDDDKFRLFFVAATRAKKHLILTYSVANSKGGEVIVFPVLPEKIGIIPADHFSQEELEKVSNVLVRTDFKLDVGQTALLTSALENYQLSITHLLNFIDVENGDGPRKFLQHNLLRFPQAKSNSAGYGTAMHAVMKWWHDWAHTHPSETLEFSKLFAQFEYQLFAQRLLTADYILHLEKGRKALNFYYTHKLTSINNSAYLEQSFKYEGVVIGKTEARITGQIDKMEIDEENKTILVTDFKTGKAINQWSKSNGKAWKYELQLTFYKLLIEGSRKFNTYTVCEGVLEFLDSGLEQHTPDSVLELKKVIETDHVEFLEKLAEVVYNKIMKLDFPDTSNYDKSLKGTQQFATDLVEGRV